MASLMRWPFFIALAAGLLSLAAALLLNWGMASAPPGDHLLFASDRDGNMDLYLLDRRNRLLLNLTQHPAADALPVWSPDGRRIAFVSDRDGLTRVYVMGSSGRDLRPLLRQRISTTAPAWSPDGRYIAFVIFGDGEATVAVTRPDGSDLRRLFSANRLREMVWSPDSSRLLAASGESAWLVHVETGTVDPLVESWAAQGVTWAPDGTRLAYPQAAGGETDLLIHNLTTDRVEAVARGVNVQDPSWSPDGSTLLYAAFDTGERLLYALDVTSGTTRLVSPVTFNSAAPDWSRDGWQVAFWSRRALYAVHVPTGAAHILDTYPFRPVITYDSDPRWRP